MSVRVRFAPSPTGMLHIGGLRTALYNELLALRHGGTFILRIEDTDRNRFVEGGIENIIRTLEWAGVRPAEGPYFDANGDLKQRGDFGPYIQSERLEIYHKYAAELVAKGQAYYCFCSPTALEEMKKKQEAAGRPVMYDERCGKLAAAEAEARVRAGEPHVIRLRVPNSGKTDFNDAIRGSVSFENAGIDDQVLIKSDGFPTYHLAVVVDDHLMGITHVIRGEEWLPSTPKHVLLYQIFGWQPPIFAHLPLLLNPDRSKLSKRQGDVAVEDYRQQGYLPDAIVNFIALLGWNPSGSQEIYAKDELAQAFDLEKINSAGAVFNREKLDWLNREYIKRLDEARLLELTLPFFAEAGIFERRDGQLRSCLHGGLVAAETARRALSLERQRVNTLKELAAATRFYFDDKLKPESKILPGKKSDAATARDRLGGLMKFLMDLPAIAFDEPKSLEKPTLEFVAQSGWTNAETLWPMRVALSGLEASPSPFEIAWVLGRDEVLHRLERAIEILK